MHGVGASNGGVEWILQFHFVIILICKYYIVILIYVWEEKWMENLNVTMGGRLHCSLSFSHPQAERFDYSLW